MAPATQPQTPSERTAPLAHLLKPGAERAAEADDFAGAPLALWTSPQDETEALALIELRYQQHLAQLALQELCESGALSESIL